MRTTTNYKLKFFICEVEYCDFVVCHFPEDNRELDIYIERVLSNEEFWSGCIEKSSDFFRVCILPELVGQWYSQSLHAKKKEQPLPVTSTPQTPVFCYCQQPEDERQMIACDNPECNIVVLY